MDDSERSAAFEAVVGEVHEPLRRYLRRRCPASEVDDVLNDTLLVIWRRIDAVPAEALPWSYGVARRTLANRDRGDRRRRRLHLRVAGVTDAAPTVTWTDAADVAMQEALDRLGPDDREVIRLWAWEQLEPREIAQVLDTTPNAVSVRLSRAKRRLRSDLGRQDRVPAGHERTEDHTELER